MDNDAFIQRIASLAQKWNEAEKWVKEGENINREVVTASINELRYAGRRIVDAFESYRQKNEKQTEEHIDAVEDNLNKARHDVVDAIFSFCAERANQRRDEVGMSNAQKHFPDYAKLFALIKDMAEKIELSREEREQRDEIYGELIDKLPDLKILCNEFEVSVDPIQEIVEKELKKEKESKNRAIVLAVISWIITIVVAAIYISSR